MQTGLVVNRSIELFSGAGGLALGVAQAGFMHDAVIEINREACRSLRENAATVPQMRNWRVIEGDVHEYDFRRHAGLGLIAAGAPCQPWSLGGKHRGFTDGRNLFPEVFRAVRETHPQAVIVENVKGLLRASFREYFEYILSCISTPDLAPRRAEDWRAHRDRVRRAIDRQQDIGVRYDVGYQLLNAADFGVPQRRERVFVIALRSDLRAQIPRLEPTHSADSLFAAKWIEGSYWHEHGIKRPKTPKNVSSRIVRLQTDSLFRLQRWRTVRDALQGLPEPRDGEAHPTIANHVGNAGARAYPGHTGSPLDEPAKTLKAGDHGVPGGENMLRRDDGSVRYFTVREAARLQSFPDDYVFAGAWTEGFRQLGNAVPVALGEAVARSVRHALEYSKAISRQPIDRVSLVREPAAASFVA